MTDDERDDMLTERDIVRMHRIGTAVLILMILALVAVGAWVIG